jgi:hypothetical protein
VDMVDHLFTMSLLLQNANPYIRTPFIQGYSAGFAFCILNFLASLAAFAYTVYLMEFVLFPGSFSFLRCHGPDSVPTHTAPGMAKLQEVSISMHVLWSCRAIICASFPCAFAESASSYCNEPSLNGVRKCTSINAWQLA